MLLSVGKNVWEDIEPDSQSFIQSYIQQYPEVFLFDFSLVNLCSDQCHSNLNIVLSFYYCGCFHLIESFCISVIVASYGAPTKRPTD